MSRIAAIILMLLINCCLSQAVYGSIHSAPVVVNGYKIKYATRFPIISYRLYKTAPDGTATPIPFQIDEINEWGDYVLDRGKDTNIGTGNGLFDPQDELVFMGDDVGPVSKPKKWKTEKPLILYEVKLQKKHGEGLGAVYLGIYFKKAPPLSKKQYVVFDRKNAEVKTSRYKYGFDQNNWLVSRKVEMVKQGTAGKNPTYVPLLDSTTFYLKADLKYFLTVTANHASISSTLDAHKIGPIRTLIRISFYYTFLKLNFELGMYTEISFFSNAVYLPAILYNPLDGDNSLNSGSGFYYGLALKDNPSNYSIKSNMPKYREKGILDFFKKSPKTESTYWVTAAGNNRMLYMEVKPSKEMRKAGAIPMFYQENKTGGAVRSRVKKEVPLPLGKSGVNLALFFDMTKMYKGEHTMGVRLFFENTVDEKKLTSFKELSDWQIEATRL